MLQEVDRPKKVFTVGEANRTLPLVSRIIGDIVLRSEDMARAHDRARKLMAAGEARQAEAEEKRFMDLAEEIEQFVEELERLGCLCKDPVRGLVDFPARMGDRIVYLCWKQGEPEVQFYHELNAGFAGRKPLRGGP